MKLIDAMRQVDRSPANHNHVEPDELNDALEANHRCVEWSAFNEEVREYWLLKWLCTDTHVGDSVGFIGDEPVYLRRQTARKGGHTYMFVSLAAAAMVKEMLAKHSTESCDPSLLDPDEEIAETYAVAWANGLLAQHGTYNGRKVTHARNGWYKTLETDIFAVIDETGEKVTIPVTDFLIPLHLSPKE